MNYMVMECHPAYAVVLSSEGEFLKVANMHYEVGQTVSQVVEMKLPQTSASAARKQTQRLVLSFAAMAACLMVVFGNLFMNHLPYASVYMAINPEVRIDVSRTDRVLGIEGVNADGTALLSGYDSKRKDLDLVMDELVDRAIEMGYLHEGGKITLTLDADEKWVSGHEEALNTRLSQHLDEKMGVTIDIAIPSVTPTETPDNISSGETVVIPMAPESDYGDSVYDDSGDSGYDDDRDDADDEKDDISDDDDMEDDSGDTDSAYDDAVSAYGDSRQDGQTDYGSREHDSNYEEPKKEPARQTPTRDSASDYEEDSPYDAPGDDGNSRYKPSGKNSSSDKKTSAGDSTPAKKESPQEKPASKKADSDYDASEKNSDYDD